MRWLVFILLLLGTLFSVSAFVPADAGNAELMRPFATDAKPIVSFVGGLPNVSGAGVTLLLAGVAVLFFLAAIAGLFWKVIPIGWWPALVSVAVAASLLLYFLYFGIWMITPILVDAILLWGVLTKRWTAEALPVRSLPSDAAPIHPLMNIPVPWTFVLTFLIGLGVQYLVPFNIAYGDTLSAIHITGFILMACGVLLAISSLGLFRTAHTTTVPFEAPSKLITWGPYRFSRNPMYFSLTLIYLGEAAILAQIWPLLVLPLLLIYINGVVIPVEEDQLRQAFGDDYRQYRARVRRWI